MSKCPKYCMLCSVRDMNSSLWQQRPWFKKAMYLFSEALWQLRHGTNHKEVL